MKHLDKKSFSVVEILFVVALMAIITIAISPYFGTTVRGWEAKDRQLEIFQTARVAMEELSKTFKAATNFTAINANSVQFVDHAGNNLQYRLQGNILQKNSGTWVDLAEPLDSLNFTYYDQNGTITSDPATVRTVEFTLVVNDSSQKVKPISFTSLATLRKDLVAGCSCSLSGQGVITSKRADFSTNDTAFTTADTFYIKIWTDQIACSATPTAQYQLREDKTGPKDTYNYNLDDNTDCTYTDSVSLSGFDAGNWDLRQMKIQQASTKYEPADIDLVITNP